LRGQPDIELKQQLRSGRNDQVADVDDAGALRPAGRTAVVDRAGPAAG
jgi:hypothetical protein